MCEDLTSPPPILYGWIQSNEAWLPSRRSLWRLFHR